MPNGRGCFIRHPAGLPVRTRGRGRCQPGATSRVPPRAGVYIESDHWIEPGTLLDVEVPAFDSCWTYRALVLTAEGGDGHCELLLGFVDEHEAFHARMVEQLCHIEAWRREIARTEGRTLDLEEAAREWIANHADGFPAL